MSDSHCADTPSSPCTARYLSVFDRDEVVEWQNHAQPTKVGSVMRVPELNQDMNEMKRAYGQRKLHPVLPRRICREMSWEDKGSQRKQRKSPATQAQEHHHTCRFWALGGDAGYRDFD